MRVEFLNTQGFLSINLHDCLLIDTEQFFPNKDKIDNLPNKLDYQFIKMLREELINKNDLPYDLINEICEKYKLSFYELLNAN